MSFSEQIPEKNAGHLSSERRKKKKFGMRRKRHEVAELLFLSHDVSRTIKYVAHSG